MYVKNEAKGREGRGRGRPHAEMHVAGKLLVVCITLQIKPNETCLQAMITRTCTRTLALHLLLTQPTLGNQSGNFRIKLLLKNNRLRGITNSHATMT